MTQTIMSFDEKSKLKTAFEKYHFENPEVWQEFEKFAFKGIATCKKRGIKYLSADMVMHRVRWETSIETSTNDYKISNNHVAYYSRLFQKTWPTFAYFFRNKSLKS